MLAKAAELVIEDGEEFRQRAFQSFIESAGVFGSSEGVETGEATFHGAAFVDLPRLVTILIGKMDFHSRDLIGISIERAGYLGLDPFGHLRATFDMIVRNQLH